MTDPIVTESLAKTFPGGVHAVRDVSIHVRKGEIFGFLGPNGAGKTTTVGMLTTNLRPTGGRAFVNGTNVLDDPAGIRRRIGLVFQESTSDDELTGRENLELAGALFGMPRSAVEERSRELLERLQIADAADRLVKTYSGGMRRRLELAAGILHTPEILFLDEPTLGLDPQGRAGMGEAIRRLRDDAGVTVFVTTHYLDEADRLCDRVAIIDHGEIRALGTPSELKQKIGGDVVSLETGGDGGDLAAELSRLPGVTQAQAHPGGYRLKAPNGESVVPAAVELCLERGVPLRGVSVKQPSLDEVFLEMTGREYREEEGGDRTAWALRVNAVRGRAR